MATLYGTGVSSGDLVTALKELRTDFNAVLAKLDADTGVTATNYVSTCSIPAIQSIDYSPGGCTNQEDIIKRMQDTVTYLAAVTAKLDTDSLTNSDYASTINVTDTINVAGGTVWNAGMSQGAMVKILSDLKTAINALTVKLDADGTVNTTTYASGNTVGFGVDATRC